MKIKKEDTIGDIVKAHPDAVPIILSYGLHCVGCHVAHWETLEQGCLGHGMSETDIDDMVTEINTFIKAKK